MRLLFLEVSNDLLALVRSTVWADLMGWAKLVALWALDELHRREVKVATSLALSRFRGAAFWQWWHGMFSLRSFVVGCKQGAQRGESSVTGLDDAMTGLDVAIRATLRTQPGAIALTQRLHRQLEQAVFAHGLADVELMLV